MKAIAICMLLACRETTPATERSVVSCAPCEARIGGFERVRVRVLLRDADGRPISGQRLSFGAEDCGVTDGDGLAQATFGSDRAGSRLVQVRLADGTPIGAVAVVFFAGSFPRVELSSP
ncbi:MAG: Ig-like domain-containing protein [Myxococcales bacterium]